MKGKQTYPRTCVCGIQVTSAFEDAHDEHWKHEDRAEAYRFGRRLAPVVFLIGLALVVALLFKVLLG